MLYNEPLEHVRNPNSITILPTHYLDQREIAAYVDHVAPELRTLLETCTHPGSSRDPDILELWENSQRAKRINSLSLLATPHNLQALLYEECFGVNATPGVNEEFLESVAPTPGGLISHAQPFEVVDIDGRIEKIMALDLSGHHLNEVFAKQPDNSARHSLATAIAQSTYPPKISRDPYELHRTRLRTRLTRNLSLDEKTEQEIFGWALRYLRIVQKIPSLLQPITDEKLAPMMGLIHSSKRTKLEFWHVAWAKMSTAFLNDGIYKNVHDPLVADGMKKLLTIRTHPEFQDLFLYLSPSGYLNETN